MIQESLLYPQSIKAVARFSDSGRMQAELTQLAGYIIKIRPGPKTIAHPSFHGARRRVALLMR